MKTVRAERADGARSRHTILDAAARLATLEGLEGLSIGRLAEHIGMSKSGLYAHFGSKEELQLAIVQTARDIFNRDVVEPTDQISDPLARLQAVADGFLDYLGQRVFPGGCFFASTVSEFDTRPGPVRERISEVYDGWLRFLEGLLVLARDAGQLDLSEDPHQLVFELDAYLLMANTVFVLKDDEMALDRARRAFRSRLDRARSVTLSARA
jgi:AcrR family transcriptional regulator